MNSVVDASSDSCSTSADQSSSLLSVMELFSRSKTDSASMPPPSQVNFLCDECAHVLILSFTCIANHVTVPCVLVPSMEQCQPRISCTQPFLNVPALLRMQHMAELDSSLEAMPPLVVKRASSRLSFSFLADIVKDEYE